MIEYHVNNNFHIYNWFVKLLNDFPGSMLHQPPILSNIFLIDTKHEKNFWSSKIFSWLCCKNLTLILTIISMIRWDLRDDCDDRVDECHGDDITVMLWSDPEVFTRSDNHVVVPKQWFWWNPSNISELSRGFRKVKRCSVDCLLMTLFFRFDVW